MSGSVYISEILDGVYTSSEQNYIDAEKLLQTQNQEQIEKYIGNIPILAASEEYEDDPEYEKTMPDCPLGLQRDE
jgi:hypothetical protein